MASRRMRIKAVAKLPRPLDRSKTPTLNLSNFTEAPSPSSIIPSAMSPGGPNYSSPMSPKSPRTPVANLGSPRSYGYPPSPTQKVLGSSDDNSSLYAMPLNSPGPGIMSPKSILDRTTPRPSPAPSPVGIIGHPDSPRRPSRPTTPHGENSRDNFLSPVYSPSYCALSPGLSLGIQRNPSIAITAASMNDDSNSSRTSNISSSHSISSKDKTIIKPLSSPCPSVIVHKELSNSSSSYNNNVSCTVNNTETLRQRLQKGTNTPSTSKYAMIRKDYLAKYQNKLPDPKDLTMLHYAFFNPPRSQANPDNENGVEGGKKNSKGKKRRRTDSVDTVSSTSSDPASLSNEPSSGESKTDGPTSIAPRVKVGPDGKLIIDEQSLVIQTSEAQRAKEQLATMETVSGADYIVGSSGIYSRKKPLKRGVDWDEKETLKFYRALISCGTDFSMMATVFKGSRTRGELKAKFKREDRRNPVQISRAIATKCFDPSMALSDSEDEASIVPAIHSPPSSVEEDDVENSKSSKTRVNGKDKTAKRENLKKTRRNLKKTGELVTGNGTPKLADMPFKKPSGKMDWRVYDAMKNNLTDSNNISSSQAIEEQEIQTMYDEVVDVSNDSNPVEIPNSTVQLLDSMGKRASICSNDSEDLNCILNFTAEKSEGFKILSGFDGPTGETVLSMPSLEF